MSGDMGPAALRDAIYAVTEVLAEHSAVVEGGALILRADDGPGYVLSRSGAGQSGPWVLSRDALNWPTPGPERPAGGRERPVEGDGTEAG